MAITTTTEKFLHELGDIYDAEHQFLEAQQKMLPQATDATLKSGIEQHIQETQQQIQNIEEAYAELGQKPQRVACQAAQGIVTEGTENLEEAGSPEIRDLVIGSSLSKVEHYEISSYTGLVTAAEAMGQSGLVTLFQQNLQQEQQAAQRLEEGAPQMLRTAMLAEGTGGS